jgi:thioredoxin-related protein
MRVLAAGFVLLILTAAAANAAELLMYRRAGCPWCDTWDKVIGPIYPKTDVAKRAPVRMVDLDRMAGIDVTLRRPVRYTPTFVLVENKHEVGRIEGYPGEDFFWGLLDDLVAKLPAGGSTAAASPQH